MWRYEFIRGPELVVLKVYGTATTEGVARTLEDLEQEYRSWEAKKAIAFDLTEMGNVGAPQRAQIAAFRKEHADLIGASVTRAAYLVPGQLLRGALTAITWVMPSPVEVQVFKDLESARPWLLGNR